MEINTNKNRKREQFTFANINLLGKCNAYCFFCLGKDLSSSIDCYNHTAIHFSKWNNFSEFISKCKENNISKLYITGQNTDSLLYHYLDELIVYLKSVGFRVGIRTNGFLAHKNIETINKCDLSVGYSIHSLYSCTNWEIMGVDYIPDWDKIIPATKNPRVSIVLNRHNSFEFMSLLEYISGFNNVKYIQARRISTDNRLSDLIEDIKIYEEVYKSIKKKYKVERVLWKNAEVFSIFGKDVIFWRTTRTSVNSMNYFTDGTISDMYFIVEGYLKNKYDKTRL
jgi:molybdenum cofactor biosynthesis enzyme MoaA